MSEDLSSVITHSADVDFQGCLKFGLFNAKCWQFPRDINMYDQGIVTCS